jgi:flagellar protein FlgJ
MTSLAPIQNQPQTPNGLTEKELKKIDATANDFEAVFITEMLKPMFEMVEVDPVFGGGKGEEVFRNFQLNEYGKMISKQGGIGLADDVRAQMIHMQLSAKGQTPSDHYKFNAYKDSPISNSAPQSKNPTVELTIDQVLDQILDVKA